MLHSLSHTAKTGRGPYITSPPPTSGFITLWEAKVRRTEEFNALVQLKPPEGSVDIVQVMFLTGVPLLVSLDANGLLAIWALPPHTRAFECLDHRKLGSEQRSVTAMTWYWPNALLYMGLSNGTITVLSLAAVLEWHEVHHFFPSLPCMEEHFAHSDPAFPAPTQPKKRGSFRYSSLYTESLSDASGTPRRATFTPQTRIEVIATRECHMSPISMVSADPISKYVVSVAERSVKIWGIGLHCIGSLDQYQKEMYSFVPNLGKQFSAQGDRVVRPRDIPTAELTHPNAAFHPIPKQAPTHLESTNTPKDAKKPGVPQVCLSELTPMEPLPGSTWCGKGGGKKAPNELHGWYAGLGLSCLVLGEREREDAGDRKLIQQSFRTVQCNESLAKTRDIRILDQAVPFEPRTVDNTAIALSLPGDFSPALVRSGSIRRKSQLLAHLAAVHPSATNTPSKKKDNKTPEGNPQGVPLLTPDGEFHHVSCFVPIIAPFSAIGTGPPNRPIEVGTDIVEKLNEKRGVVHRQRFTPQPRILKMDLQYRELGPHSREEHRENTVSILSKRRTLKQLREDLRSAPPTNHHPDVPSEVLSEDLQAEDEVGAPQPVSPVSPVSPSSPSSPKVLRLADAPRIRPTYRILASPGGDSGLPDSRRRRAEHSVDAFLERANGLTSHSLTPEFVDNMKQLPRKGDPTPEHLHLLRERMDTPEGEVPNSCQIFTPFTPEPEVRALVASPVRVETPVPRGTQMSPCLIDWYCRAGSVSDVKAESPRLLLKARAARAKKKKKKSALTRLVRAVRPEAFTETRFGVLGIKSIDVAPGPLLPSGRVLSAMRRETTECVSRTMRGSQGRHLITNFA